MLATKVNRLVWQFSGPRGCQRTAKPWPRKTRSLLGASAATAPMPIDFLRNFYRRAYGMEREAAVKLVRALVDAGFIADDQRADAAIEKVALEAGLDREQLEAALKYAREQKWVAETNKAAWSVVTQTGLDATNAE